VRLRTRIVRPRFFTAPTVARLRPSTRLLLLALSALADREGRLEEHIDRIRAAALPHGKETNASVERMLRELASAGLVMRIHVDGLDILQVVDFDLDQRPHQNEPPSTLPGHAHLYKNMADVHEIEPETAVSRQNACEPRLAEKRPKARKSWSNIEGPETAVSSPSMVHHRRAAKGRSKAIDVEPSNGEKVGIRRRSARKTPSASTKSHAKVPKKGARGADPNGSLPPTTPLSTSDDHLLTQDCLDVLNTPAVVDITTSPHAPPEAARGAGRATPDSVQGAADLPSERAGGLARRLPAGPVGDLMSWFALAYERDLGTPYLPKRSDGPAVARAVKQFRLSEVRRRLQNGLRTTEPWIASTDRSLSLLLSQINRPSLRGEQGGRGRAAPSGPDEFNHEEFPQT